MFTVIIHRSTLKLFLKAILNCTLHCLLKMTRLPTLILDTLFAVRKIVSGVRSNLKKSETGDQETFELKLINLVGEYAWRRARTWLDDPYQSATSRSVTIILAYQCTIQVNQWERSAFTGPHRAPVQGIKTQHKRYRDTAFRIQSPTTQTLSAFRAPLRNILNHHYDFWGSYPEAYRACSVHRQSTGRSSGLCQRQRLPYRWCLRVC